MFLLLLLNGVNDLIPIPGYDLYRAGHQSNVKRDGGGGGGGWGWTKSWYNFSKQPFLTVALGDFNVNSNRWCKSEKHHKKAQKLRA